MSNSRPARYLRSQLGDAQRERSWAVIRARLPQTRRRSLAIRALAIAAMLALFAWVGVALRARPTEFQAATLETRANEQEALTLADGSRIVVGGSTRVHLAVVSKTRVLLQLDHGEIDAEVTHVDGRSFVVAAAGHEVAVIGTHFRVQAEEGGESPRVSVSVTRGRVEVTRVADATRRLVDAGETWSSVGKPEPAPPPPPVEEPAPADVDAGPVRPAPTVTGFRLPRRFHDLAEDGHYTDAYAELGSNGVARATRLARAPDLFKVGQVARYDGHPREAVDAFQALVKRYPNDGRAGVAGLEAGRLLLTELNDPAAAAAAFAEAMRLAPNDSFREDALARRVQALDIAGDRSACVEARQQYLSSYPQGTHAVTVARRCPVR
ncbi:Hypothetical protein A7982_03704 [Minicystis rosea]|nr:Hypothetical protein A7982_03704 [Minicystis rosea]